MLLLASTSDLLQLITTTAFTTHVQVSYVDNNLGTISPFRQNTIISSINATTIVSSPALNTIRNIKHISICAVGGAQHIVINHTDGTNMVQILDVQLGAGEEAVFNDGTGFQIFDASGSIKMALAIPIPGAPTSDPLMDGIVNVGDSGKYADSTHVHPTDTTRAPTTSPIFTGTITRAGIGTAPSYTDVAILTYDTSLTTLQMNIQNLSNGGSASSDIVATADTGTDIINYVDLGINSSTYNNADYTITGPLDSYLYANGGDLAIGTATPAQTVKIHTGGTLASNLRATISDTGLFVSGNLSGTNLLYTLQHITTTGGTTTLTNSSCQYIVFIGTLGQTIVLPNADTIHVGQWFWINNKSSNVITVKTADSITLYQIGVNSSMIVTCLDNQTVAGTWDINYIGTIAVSGKTAYFLDNIVFPGNKPGSLFNDGNGNLFWGEMVLPVNFLDIYGHSFFDYPYNTGTGVSNYLVNLNSELESIIGAILGLPRNQVRNHCRVSSSLTAQGRAGGGFAKILAECLRPKQTYPFTRNGGAGLLCYGINDIGNNVVADQALMRSSYDQCLMMAISRFRSSAIFFANGGANLTFGANWSNSAAANIEWTSGYAKSATVVDSAGSSRCTFTIPIGYKGEPIVFCLIGYHTANVATVTWGGTVTGTTGIIGTTTSLANTSIDTHGPVVVRWTIAANGLSSANAGQTIWFAITSISSSVVEIDSVWLESLKPNPVVVCNVPRLACHDVVLSFGDGVTTGVNNSFTSASAQFLSSTDAGKAIIEIDAQGAFTAGKTVSSVTNPTTIVLSGNATGAFSSIKYTLNRELNGYKLNYSTNTNFSGATVSSHTAADTDVANLNATIATVIGRFDTLVQLADLDSLMGSGDVNGLPSGIYSYYDQDGLHPNEFGVSRCCIAMYFALSALQPVNDGQLFGQLDSMASPANSPAPLRRLMKSGQYKLPEFSVWGATYTCVQGQVFATPIWVSESTENWLTPMVEQINSPAVSGSQIRIGLYDDINCIGYPQCLRQETTINGTFALGTTSGVKNPPNFGYGSGYSLHPGLYWLVLKVDTMGVTASTLRTITGPNPNMPNWIAAGGAVTPIAWQVTGVSAGILPNNFPSGGALVSTAPALGVLCTLQS
jgi:hypothetical protein